MIQRWNRQLLTLYSLKQWLPNFSVWIQPLVMMLKCRLLGTASGDSDSISFGMGPGMHKKFPTCNPNRQNTHTLYKVWPHRILCLLVTSICQNNSRSLKKYYSIKKSCAHIAFAFHRCAWLREMTVDPKPRGCTLSQQPCTGVVWILIFSLIHRIRIWKPASGLPPSAVLHQSCHNKW